MLNKDAMRLVFIFAMMGFCAAAGGVLTIVVLLLAIVWPGVLGFAWVPPAIGLIVGFVWGVRIG